MLRNFILLNYSTAASLLEYYN